MDVVAGGEGWGWYWIQGPGQHGTKTRGIYMHVCDVFPPL